MQRAEMNYQQDYYYTYPPQGTSDQGNRPPMQLSEAQVLDSNTTALQHSMRLHALHPDMEQRVSHESKPRLSKEQQDILERHFQAQPKPSTTIKRGFADNLGVPLDKINVSYRGIRCPTCY